MNRIVPGQIHSRSPADRGLARARFMVELVTLLALIGTLLTTLAPPAKADFCIQRGLHSICFYDPTPPTPTCWEASCLPSGTPTVPITGYVRDPVGNGIAGAQLYWEYGLVHSDSSGYYSINVWTDKPVTLYAVHDDHDWKSKRIEVPLTEYLLPHNFEGESSLPFLLGTIVSPEHFNVAPSTLLIETFTSAPPELGEVIAELDSGDVIQLSLDPEPVSDGWHRWFGNLEVPQGMTDGRRGFESCVVDDVDAACDPAARIPLSQIKRAEYVLDRVAPSVTFTSPSPFADVASLSEVSVSWSDDLAGISHPSMKLWLDGTSLSVVISGNEVKAQLTDVAPGIHLVETEATDLAGNLAQDSVLVTLQTLTADPAQATLVETTVPVNPSASDPPPTQVRFSAPAVEIDRFSERLNASTWVGYGELRRSFSFGDVVVEFQNELGATTEVTFPAPGSFATHLAATLGPSEVEMVAEIPPSQATIADVVVDVPTGFNTSGSTATLKTESIPMGPSYYVSAQIRSNKINDPTPVFGELALCFERTSPTYVYCEQAQELQMVAVIGGVPVPSFVAMRFPPDDDAEASAPSCTGPTGGIPATGEGCTPKDDQGNSRHLFSGSASVNFGCPVVTIIGTTTRRNLCTNEVVPPDIQAGEGFAGLYLNAWGFKEDAGSPSHMLWQQNHLDATVEGDHCGNGVTGKVRAFSYRLVSNATSLDGASNPLVGGTFRGLNSNTMVAVSLGRTTQATENSADESHPPYPAGPISETVESANYLITSPNVPLVNPGSATGIYRMRKGELIDALGVSSPNPFATSNFWQYASDQITALGERTIIPKVNLVTGTEWQSPAATGGYALRANVAFQFLSDFRECAPPTGG